MTEQHLRAYNKAHATATTKTNHAWSVISNDEIKAHGQTHSDASTLAMRLRDQHATVVPDTVADKLREEYARERITIE